MTDPGPFDVDTTFLRLRGEGSVEALPVGTDFWSRLMSGQLGNFHHEYLVTSARYESDWPGWEQHPLGDEIVILLSGAVTFVLEQDSGRRRHAWPAGLNTPPCVARNSRAGRTPVP